MFNCSNQYTIVHTNVTNGQTEIYTIRWTFPNFLDTILNSKTVREFRTPKDAVEDVPGSKFQLKILFCGGTNDLIEIYYRSPTSVILKSVLTVWHRDRNTIKKAYQTIQANKWQCLTTLNKRDLYRRLDLEFKFIVLNDVIVDRHNIPGTQLSDDFGNLLNDGNYSDVTMKSVEGEEFRVHKPVLAIRSEVLKAHFEHNTTESITNVIVTPLESEVLREVLNFVYTDKALRVDEIPEKLLAAADYYQLSRLKSLCEEALNKRLTVENAIDTLQLAELHTANSLRQSTLEFIKYGHADLITQTQGWANVKSVELIKTIYGFITADEIDAEIR